jgi:nitrite reductase/ring-hydroxylating ferredoxin subunit/DMSO/TMAO reductase YedYZ heme-binding membrane subunit
MSATYRAVQWNRQKRIYDLWVVVGALAYVVAFVGFGVMRFPEITAETLILRAFGTLALLLLHVVLAIGPLARLDRRFLPLLYNRRHLGVTLFLVAAVHGGFSIVQFHTLGDVGPLVSLLSVPGPIERLADVPFQPFGFAALLILFVMAATSHDFWLANLTAPVWKALHMSVYVAYGLLVLHVAFGVLQDRTSPVPATFLAVGFVAVVGLHVVAGLREREGDRESGAEIDAEGFVRACAVADIESDRARIVPLGGERVAVFRYDGKISAVSNVCKHQNGPLGEGKVVDGCITCPWHGWQYRPHDGTSPPPFTETIPTFRIRVRDGAVWVHPHPNPPGTPVEPVPEGGDDAGA